MKTPEEIAAEAKAAEEKAAADKAAAAAKKAELVKVRVLVDHGEHKANDVLKLDPKQATAAEDAGWADSNKDAVAYAEKLAREARED